MQCTPRSWAVVALAAFTAGYAVVLNRPFAFAGTALIGAWFVAHQRAFLAHLRRTSDELTVSQVPDRTGARVEETIRVHLSATMEADDPAAGRSPALADDAVAAAGDGSPDTDTAVDDRSPDTDPSTETGAAVEYAIAAGLPTATAAGDRLSVRLDPGESRASASAAVEWPVAGRHRFDPASVTVADGWFEGTITAGDAPVVTVEPRGPRSIHVGEGGDRLVSSIGHHESDRLGAGIEPAEVREYAPGDDVARIDWNATARLSTPHVREFESESDRRTGIVVDARPSLAVGPPGETALEYLKQVSLAVVGSARRLEDPVGLVTVGEAGLGTAVPTSAASETIVRIRQTLLDLAPLADEGTSGGRYRADRPGRTGQGPAVTTVGVASGGGESTTAADARAAQTRLDGDDAFSTTLGPFYADRAAYVRRIESDPLFAAVDELLAREPGRLWTVLLTDDADRAEVVETVSNARARGSEVLVAIAPRVLYEPDGLADVTRAYDRYVDFEEFRRRLGGRSGVTALEVGPADRIETVLEAGREGERP